MSRVCGRARMYLEPPGTYFSSCGSLLSAAIMCALATSSTWMRGKERRGHNGIFPVIKSCTTVGELRM